MSRICSQDKYLIAIGHRRRPEIQTFLDQRCTLVQNLYSPLLDWDLLISNESILEVLRMLKGRCLELSLFRSQCVSVLFSRDRDQLKTVRQQFFGISIENIERVLAKCQSEFVYGRTLELSDEAGLGVILDMIRPMVVTMRIDCALLIMTCGSLAGPGTLYISDKQGLYRVSATSEKGQKQTAKNVLQEYKSIIPPGTVVEVIIDHRLKNVQFCRVFSFAHKPNFFKTKEFMDRQIHVDIVKSWLSYRNNEIHAVSMTIA